MELGSHHNRSGWCTFDSGANLPVLLYQEEERQNEAEEERGQKRTE